MRDYPRIWALLGHRRGDNSQVLSLSRQLGVPFETRTLYYNPLRKVDNRILGHSLISVRAGASKWLQPPWPDLVIGIGRRSVPVARYIRRASGGRTKLVQLGDPRLHSSHFDLVITTPQYSLPQSDRILRLPFAIGSAHAHEPATVEEHSFFDELSRPHRLMLIGGPAKPWQVLPQDIAAAARTLMRRCEEDGGTLLISGSQRTPAPVLSALAEAISGTRHRLIRGPAPRYGPLLQDSDEIYVTADSVSMLSEAVYSGKPVGMIPIRLSRRGERQDRLRPVGILKPPRRDVRRVWDTLRREGLVGTLEDPVRGSARNPVDQAAEAVLRLLGIQGSR